MSLEVVKTWGGEQEMTPGLLTWETDLVSDRR